MLMLLRFDAEDTVLLLVIGFCLMSASCKMGIICVLRLFIVMACFSVATSLLSGLSSQATQHATRL